MIYVRVDGKRRQCATFEDALDVIRGLLRTHGEFSVFVPESHRDEPETAPVSVPPGGKQWEWLMNEYEQLKGRVSQLEAVDELRQPALETWCRTHFDRWIREKADGDVNFDRVCRPDRVLHQSLPQDQGDAEVEVASAVKLCGATERRERNGDSRGC
jgi:hypothetical protein